MLLRLLLGIALLGLLTVQQPCQASESAGATDPCLNNPCRGDTEHPFCMPTVRFCVTTPCPQYVCQAADPCLDMCALDIRVCQVTTTAADGSTTTSQIQVSRDPCRGCKFPECPGSSAPGSPLPPQLPPLPPKPPGCDRACTKDLRVCPSGATVARNPCRDCQFDSCPSVGPPLVLEDPVSPGKQEEDPDFEDILAAACLGNPCRENLQFPVCRPVIMDCIQPPCPQFICTSEEPDYELEERVGDIRGGGAIPVRSVSLPGGDQMVCSADVKTCDDGTVVARDPSNCQFRCPSRWVLEFWLELAPEEEGQGKDDVVLLEEVRSWLARDLGVAPEHIELTLAPAGGPGVPRSIQVSVPAEYLNQDQVHTFALMTFGGRHQFSVAPSSSPSAPASASPATSLGVVGIGKLREHRQGLCEDGRYSGSCLRRQTSAGDGPFAAGKADQGQDRFTQVTLIVLGSLSGILLVLGIVGALRRSLLRPKVSSENTSSTAAAADDSSSVAMTLPAVPRAVSVETAEQMA